MNNNSQLSACASDFPLIKLADIMNNFHIAKILISEHLRECLIKLFTLKMETMADRVGL